ncbi:MAG: hypothetical protein HZA51_18595 [Planctomycetes bacterium]|nr:hypothetical protein [Planctomycetota bacterium]
MGLRRWAPLTISVLLCAIAQGCGRMEWNWDLAWWKEPKRVVPPSKPDSTRHNTEPTHHTENRAAPLDAPPEQGPSPADQLVNARKEARPFYQLYLVSETDGKPVERGERVQKLKHVGARTCALALESLCVPLGRSSNTTECYLIYEDRNEFEAALALAPLLDVPVNTAPGSGAGGDPFSSGVGAYYAVIEKGPIVERSLIEAADKRLAEAVQSPHLSTVQRWTASILAARLMMDYKYDYPAARSYCMQAERLCTAGTLELFTAWYWRAEALNQEGNTTEAAGLRRRIDETYGPTVTRSQLIQRGKSERPAVKTP